MYSSELEQRAQSVSNMLSAAGETRPWSTASSQWPLDLTPGWDRWAEREVKRWEPEKGKRRRLSLAPAHSNQREPLVFSTLVEKKIGGGGQGGEVGHVVHLHVDSLPLAAHKRGGKKLDFTAS